ncbi:Hypothetical_protein [Hexamita inflata]|uniref:Hypothetical_protein n=1 Tax=Hexamita inflata TaxID=28002 RepID=A0AA86TTB8_9EUKA|nr:Hypothetical protein HINF_LOCUS15601 [Hexamita inflata]
MNLANTLQILKSLYAYFVKLIIMRFCLRCDSVKSVAEGKIPRFKVLSCHQRAFRIGKRQPLHCFLRNAGTTQVDSRIDRLHEVAALRPWMLVPESLVALAAEVPNVHRCIQNQ